MPARMTVLTGRVFACLGVASALSLGSPAGAADAGLQPDGSFVVGKDASEVIGQYLSKVTGRYGGLAISDDGTAAAYYICQSRLWKNCDDYSLDEDVVSIPSGNLAAKLAEKRCRAVTSSNCTVLFINTSWKRQFVLAQ
jgi:hypothetical protein